MIIATAGHVDHGKTALVRALTGVDADRLPEEKRRGMTIDLGFAYADLGSGRATGFVDVPGHERLLHNMLAGVLAIDVALLVVAADDGPMPQTREHLAILGLVGVPRLVAAVTKVDRVPPARVADVEAALRRLLAQHGFPSAPVFAVSSATADGIEALRAHLVDGSIASPPRHVIGGFRLAVDRSFILPGVGVVATGTVAAGRVAVGDRLLVTPRRIAVRVRSLHAQNRPVEEAQAGDRCALALAGAALDRTQVGRGDWLVEPRLHAPTPRLDAFLRTPADGAALRHGARVHVHLGTADLMGRVAGATTRDIGPGEGGYVQLRLDRPAAALFGDRVVVRDEAARVTLAGGHVVDPAPPPRRHPRDERLAVLAAMDHADPAAALARLLDAAGCVDLAAFARTRNLDDVQLARVAEAACPVRIGRPGAQVAVSPARRAALRETLLGALARWHAAHPEIAGPNKAELLRFAAPQEAPELLEAALLDLVADGLVAREHAALRLPEHRPRLAAADEALWSRVAPLLAEAGLRPPRLREIADALGTAPEDIERKLVRFERFGRLLRVADNRFFLPSTVVALARAAAALAAEAEDGTFTAGAFKDRAGIGRNLTIEVLEFLDRIGVTRRLGDRREVVRRAEDVIG